VAIRIYNWLRQFRFSSSTQLQQEGRIASDLSWWVPILGFEDFPYLVHGTVAGLDVQKRQQ